MHARYNGTLRGNVMMRAVCKFMCYIDLFIAQKDLFLKIDPVHINLFLILIYENEYIYDL